MYLSGFECVTPGTCLVSCSVGKDGWDEKRGQGGEKEEFLDQGRVSAKQREEPLPLTITGNKLM